LFSFTASRPAPTPTLFPYTTLFRSRDLGEVAFAEEREKLHLPALRDRERRLRAGPDDLAGLDVAREHEARGRGDDVELGVAGARSEEHTSELQSRENLVCRLLLEKK